MSDSLPEKPDKEPTFSEIFASSLAKSGFAKVAPGEKPDGGALLGAVGGVRGLLEALVPAFLFLLVYVITSQLVISVIASAALSVVFIVLRVVKKLPILPAVAGLIGIVFSALVALFTGKDVDNFLPGLIINLAYGSAILVTIIVRWPFIGVISGFLTGDWKGWRRDAAKYRVALVTSWIWFGLFALRLAVQYPLYLAGEVTWLAAAKLILGTPLFAAVIWVTWLLARSAYSPGPSAPEQHSGEGRQD